MVAIPVQKISNGMKLEFKSDVWTIVEFAHVKPGKGGAFVRMKLKSLTSGKVVEETVNASEKVEQTDVEYRRMSYLYHDGADFVFMDTSSYEQLPVSEEMIGEPARFLVENMEVAVLIWNGKIIGVELPNKVDLEVTDTINAEKGNTATNVTKEATVESGAVVHVPLFINKGDKIRVDTRDGAYESRV